MTTIDVDAPRDDLYRGLFENAVELRDDSDSGSLMHGHFATFDNWTEINSWFEGRFMERIAPGAFRKTMRERRDQIKVQFDHGHDMHVGDSPLGPIDVLREDDVGGYYEVPLLDTDYNRDRVLPLLQGRLMSGEQRGSLLGASFRFRVVRDEWVREPKKSRQNPEALPERTILETALYELGPVVFPAYATATAGVRSLTDHYQELRMRRNGTAEMAARSLLHFNADPSAAADALRSLSDAARQGTSEPDPDAGPATSGTTNHDADRLRLAAHMAGVTIRKDR